jgi:hypothetical protein
MNWLSALKQPLVCSEPLGMEQQKLGTSIRYSTECHGLGVLVPLQVTPSTTLVTFRALPSTAGHFSGIANPNILNRVCRATYDPVFPLRNALEQSNFVAAMP